MTIKPGGLGGFMTIKPGGLGGTGYCLKTDKYG